MTAVHKPMDEWKNVPWTEIERNVFKLQKRIYRASQKGERKKVHRLQRLLMKSQSGKLLAVRRVTQDNQGKKTAGVDGVKALGPKQRMDLCKTLKVSTKAKAKPVRRVWIPKAGGSENRPLGIPTMADRALQSLVKLALEPQWEARFEPNSYGFRPGRACQDAIEAIFTAIARKAKWVLDADIAKCFDRICHQELLKRVDTWPTLRRQLKAWLKAGVLQGGKLFPTEQGTPQGGCISPLLANIALHGLETYLITHYHQTRGKRPRIGPPQVIRYADDFVVLHPDREVIKECQQLTEQWLKPMGLELKASKTQVVHTLEAEEGSKPGFNFLGFNIRQYPVGRTHSGRCVGRLLGFKTIIKPSAEAMDRHVEKLREVLKARKGASQSYLIGALNPVIIGWCNYYASVVSKKLFARLSHVLFHMLWGWARPRHSNKGKKWIAAKYWRHDQGKGWTFQARGGGPELLRHHATGFRKHIKVAGQRSPYDGDWLYWSIRMGRSPQTKPKVARLLKAQRGRCQECGLYFRTDDRMEIDHVRPKTQGGIGTRKNLQLLHRHCHHKKTAHDRLRGAHDKRQPVEEPYDGKLSSTVLKPSRRGDSPA